MELARITLNVASIEARRDIADPYQMHSTLARAFVTSSSDKPDRFLWRLESPRNGDTPWLLVQSAAGGDWHKLLREVPGWAVGQEVRIWEPEKHIKRGMALQFRLRANTAVARNGKRVGLWRADEQRQWFLRQFEKAGLSDAELTAVTSERVVGKRRRGEGGVTVCAAQVDGVGVVESAEQLVEAIRHGIGHAKMMGLGLLTVARVG